MLMSDFAAPKCCRKPAPSALSGYLEHNKNEQPSFDQVGRRQHPNDQWNLHADDVPVGTTANS
jgi:hypothetical protein